MVRVDQHRVGEAQRHGVDREVPASQVVLDPVRVRNRGLAALGAVDVASEGRDLEPLTADVSADGSEALPLQPDVVCPPFDQGPDLLGAGVSRQVDVGRFGAEESVPDRAADQVALVAGRGDPVREPRVGDPAS